MKLRFYFSVAASELRTALRLLLMLGLITICLFSISVAFLTLGMSLPGQIAKEVAEKGYDHIFLWMLSVDDAHALESQPIELVETYTSYAFDTGYLEHPSESEVSGGGGVLFEWMGNTKLSDELRANLCDGVIEPQTAGHILWIHQSIAAQFNWSAGQTVSFLGRDGDYLCDLTIQGIFTGAERENSYYISESAYVIFLKTYADCQFEALVRPQDFFDTNKIISWAWGRGVVSEYNKEVVRAAQMLDYAFHVFTIILMLVLAGVFFNFLSVYFEKRASFYAIHAALGMSNADILKVMGCLCEIILIPAVGISIGTAMLIVHNIAEQADSLFGSVSVSGTIPASGFHVLLAQGIAAVVLFRFHRKLKREPIIRAIRT